MALHKESHDLKEYIDNFESIKSNLGQSTGLNIELEVIDKETFFIHCEKLNTTIEANLDSSRKALSLLFPPKRKGYIEYAFLNVISSYLENVVDIPAYAKKKWVDLSALEKILKR